MATFSKRALFFVAVVVIVGIVALVVITNTPLEDIARRLNAQSDAIGSKVDCNGKSYYQLREKFLQDGYVVFRSCSLKTAAVDAAATFLTPIQSGRVGDAWQTEQSVMDIATDPDSIEILGYLNGRSVFPFQTLNFPVATQQPTHSDVIHFDTLPQRGLMTASWVALEDIHPDAGPLKYYPGSHKMGLWDMDELGMRVHTLSVEGDDNGRLLYEKKLQEAIEHHDLKAEYGTIKKGESFAWAASLLHGGDKLRDPTRTRKSQVNIASFSLHTWSLAS